MFGTNDYFHIMKKVYYALYHVYEDEQANKDEEKTTLIDEIDDNMSLDELMSLYEKKFKD